MKVKNLGVVGSRSFTDYELLKNVLDEFTYVEKIISGGASGADFLAAKYADETHNFLQEYFPDYEKFGKAAPLERNKLIVKDCDFLVAFWDGESRGTKHSLNLAKASKIPTLIVYF